MSTLKLKLPDKLARQAKEAGLLTQKSMRQMLQEAMRRQAAAELLKVADRVAKTGIPAMTLDEIQVEVNAVRAARRAKNKKSA